MTALHDGVGAAGAHPVVHRRLASLVIAIAVLARPVR